MHWIAPSEKNADNAALEKRLWDAADQFRANSELKPQEYSAPGLGLIFLRLLDAMARALYRDWFVHFRFPGHEKHPSIASPLSDIPQPPRDLLDRFFAIAAPSFRLIYKLHLQIQNLRRTRDLLLPRLVGHVESATK